MFSASIKNKDGNILPLTGDEPTYQLIDIVGLNPPAAQINTTHIVGMDGALFNSSYLNTRNIVLTIKINGDAEQNRLTLYRFFKTKEPCVFYYSNGRRNVQIDGYVESVECGLFTNAEKAQISIICPSTYFRDINEIVNDISAVREAGLFQFPFYINQGEPIEFSQTITVSDTTIVNSSESECGMEIEVSFDDSITGLIQYLLITNETTGDWLALDCSRYGGGGLPNNAVVYISTVRGKKNIRVTEGVNTYNGFSLLVSGSTFIQLQPGNNEMSYAASTNITVTNKTTVLVKHTDIYRGV